MYVTGKGLTSTNLTFSPSGASTWMGCVASVAFKTNGVIWIDEPNYKECGSFKSKTKFDQLKQSNNSKKGFR